MLKCKYFLFSILMIGFLSSCALNSGSDLVLKKNAGGGNDTIAMGTSRVGVRDFGAFREQLKVASGIDLMSSPADINPFLGGAQTLRQAWDLVNPLLPQSNNADIKASTVQGAMVLAEAVCSVNFLAPATGFFAGVPVNKAIPLDRELNLFLNRMAKVMWRESGVTGEDFTEFKSLFNQLHAGQSNNAQKLRTAWVGICAVAAVSGSGLEM